MPAKDIADDWARYFGLAAAPLFHESKEQNAYHYVLLDGGFGSFAVSATDELAWDSAQGAEWAWSSDLAHHVAVTQKDVTVIQDFTPDAVENNEVREVICGRSLAPIHFASVAPWWRSAAARAHAHAPASTKQLRDWLDGTLSYVSEELSRV